MVGRVGQSHMNRNRAHRIAGPPDMFHSFLGNYICSPSVLSADFCQIQSGKMLCEIRQNKVLGLGFGCETGVNINQYHRLQGGQIPDINQGPASEM